MPSRTGEISKPRRKNGAPLATSLRNRLQKVATRLGEQMVADRIGINSVTLLRAMSGMPVQRATSAVIAGAIDDLEA